MRAAFLLGLGFILATRGALADGAAAKVPTFSVENLAVDGRVVAVDAADLDGDGKLDLIAAVLKGEKQQTVRTLAVFWNRGGSFAAKPDLIVPLDADVCAFDLADVDGKAGAELLIVTASGIRAHAFVGRAIGPTIDLLAQPTLFLRPASDQLLRYRVAQALGSHGEMSLLVPGMGTLSIYQRDERGFTRRSQLDVDMEMAVQGGSADGVSITASFPAMRTADIDGDGRLDLILVKSDEARGYLQKADGSFPSKPNFTHLFGVAEKAEGNVSVGGGPDVRFVDVDGDGLADAVITVTKTTGITSADTSVYLFFGSPRGFAAKPDQTIRTEGASFTTTQIADVTGDGHPDLILPSFKLGIMAIIRMLTSGSAKVKFLLYPFGSNRRFAEKPSAERWLSFDVNLEGGSDMQAHNIDADFFGNKQHNLAFGTGEGELSLFGAGEPGHLFAEDPMAKVSVRAFGALAPFDLDGSGRSDLVLHYPHTHAHESELAVVHNHGVK